MQDSEFAYPTATMTASSRRLLVRLFGYSAFAKPQVINEDPLLVRG